VFSEGLAALPAMVDNTQVPHPADWNKSTGAVSIPYITNSKSKTKMRKPVLFLLLFALVVAVLHSQETPSGSFRVPSASGTHLGVSISPNGKHVAITTGGRGMWKLRVKDLESGQLRVIEDTRGARSPFWSPDSRFIGFVTWRELKKVSAEGGPSIRICQMPVALAHASWSPDADSIVFKASQSSGGEIYEVAARGGTPKLLISSEQDAALSWPRFLPEAGSHVLMYTYRSVTKQTMVVEDLDTGRREDLGSGRNPLYSSSGHILYQSSSTWAAADTSEAGTYDQLWALPFSVDTLKATGERFLVAENARSATVAGDDTLAYWDVELSRDLAWRDRGGHNTVQILQEWSSEFRDPPKD